MPAVVTVVHKFAKVPNQFQRGVEVIDATSSGGWTADLSPFLLGPCDLYGGLVAQNMENAWQHAKVYAVHVDVNNHPKPSYWEWAQIGWNNPRAVRYPMGKGSRPQYSLWDGKQLGYIDARKLIYAPLYAEAVQRTDGWKQLVRLYNTSAELYIRDFDGWSMTRANMNNLTEVLNNPNKIMGHAFVLKMLLENDAALEQIALR